MLRSVIATALLLSAALAADPAAAPAEVAALLVRADSTYALREDPAQLEASRQALEAAARLAPDDAAVLWRLARLEVWRAEDPSIADGVKSELGKRAWDYGERAAAADPDRVEGWFYAVSGMGNYSLGIGIFSALRQGIEGKFKDRLARAEKLDPAFLAGGIQVAWGRFWFKLPWPKHDAKKSEAALRAGLARNPDSVRAHVYLGDLLLDEGHKARARAEYQAALARPPGLYDAPEERRWQGVARSSLAALDTK
jgi:tetratricopeptide (TPR) repeat protein